MHRQGQIRFLKPVFLSKSIFDAFRSGRPWDEENYVLIEEKFVWPVWITRPEAEELSKLTEFDEIADFAETLDILAIPKDKFDKWRAKREE